MTDEQQKTPKDEPQKTPTSGRTLRRLRAQFRVELLGKAKPTPSDQILIDLAAQAARFLNPENRAVIRHCMAP